MAIVKMTKFNLFAFEEDVNPLLDELQRFEYVHFTDTQTASEENELERVEIPQAVAENQEEITKLQWMIDLLDGRVEKPSGLKAMKEGLANYTFQELEHEARGIEYKPLYEKLRDVNQELDGIQQQMNNLEQEIADLVPWSSLTSEVSLLKDTEELVVLPGIVQLKSYDAVKDDFLNLQYSYLQEVSKEKNNVYLIAIMLKDEYDKAIEILRRHGFNRVEILGEQTPAKEIEFRKEKIEALKADKKQHEERLDHYTEHLPKLKLLYEYKMNQKLKLSANENFMKLSEVNITQGYIPMEKAGAFDALLSKTLGNRYYLQTEDAVFDDAEVPIIIENNKFVTPFESITTMYALPRYNEIDPTPFFAIFYWIFFGMMAADFAYGLILFVGSGIALKMFNLKPSMRKFVTFFFYLSISVMIWGLIYASAFGMSLPYKPLLNSSTDAIKLLGLSVIFGGVHLFYGMAIQAYMKIRDGEPLAAFFDVGLWYLALIGAIVFGVGSMISIPPIVTQIGKWMMIIGMVGIVLFTARDAGSIVGRLVGGLYNLYGISSYVGDFVSYSRLMALGLSGGFIATAINMIVEMVSGSLVGIVFGAVIFLGGHAFNTFLSMLSAYVHTSRLTYVEFFGKFYEGGGKKFNLFRNEPKYINIK